MDSLGATSRFTVQIKGRTQSVHADQLQPRGRQPDGVVVALPSRVPLAVETANALRVPADLFIVHGLGASARSNSRITALLTQLQLGNPDLRVLEIQKQSRTTSWLNGSAGDDVFHKTGWPVLVMGPHYTEAEAPLARLPNVLCATDLSAGAGSALLYAYAIARKQQARLVVVQVEDSCDGEVSEQEALLKGLRTWLKGQALEQGEEALSDVPCTVRFGKPEQKILETAAELRSSMIVMGAHGLGAAENAAHFAGHTVCEVVGSAYCPVLIVPAALQELLV
jgi:nucleotide-binding universal stress UspA family protein